MTVKSKHEGWEKQGQDAGPYQSREGLDYSLCIRLLELHNRVPQTEQLKQQKLIFSQSKRLEFPGQNVNRVGLF